MTYTPQQREQDDHLVLAHDRRKNPNTFNYTLFSELGTTSTAKDHIIKGIFARGETSAWIAPPGGGKSALLTSAAISIASGKDWFGHKNKAGPTGVVIFAPERADLTIRRLKAHGERDGLSQLPIAVVSGVIDLMNPATVQKIIATIRLLEDKMGIAIGFTSWDTFAKLIAAGDGDENLARDCGKVFTNLQRIKEQINAHFALIGHTGKDESRGWRGSNASLADTDLMVAITGDRLRTASVIKANDAPDGPLFSFKSENHDFGPDEDGDPTTVNIVSNESIEISTITKGSREDRLTPNQRTMFSILHDAGSAGLSTEEWNERAREVGLGVKRKATLHDLSSALKSKGLVNSYSNRWTVRN